MATVTLKINGMDCAEEVNLLRAQLGPLPGVENLAFDLLNSKLTVSYVDQTISPTALIAAVEKTGMRAERFSAAETSGGERLAERRSGRTATTVLSGLLIAAGFATHAALRGWFAALAGEETAMPLAAALLYLGATAAGGVYVAPKAWQALLRRRPDMNLLMTLAVFGAIMIGQFLEAATVAFLFALSLALEAWSVGRARRAISALMALTPDTARIIRTDRREQVISTQEVSVGSTIVVRPGEKIPLDGTVLKGETTVNQAPITGEAMPVAKAPGDTVFAGTINGEGAVEIVTTKPAENTTLARIVKMVGDAQSKRSPNEQWVDRFAQHYTPVIMVLALAVMVLPPLLVDGAWSDWFYRGLVLLVIGCPCALVISTPVAVVAALTSAARHGILIKGGPYVEMPAHLQAVALDKTGTLTRGHPEVWKVHPFSGHNEHEVLELAAAVESRSEHPLARAIERYASARGLHTSAAEDFQALKGKGGTATIAGRSVWVGSHRYLEERAQETPELHQLLVQLANEGHSAVVVGESDHVCGLIAISDTVREEARLAVADLRAAGVKHIIMLTGDNKVSGDNVAQATGVDEVRAELLPEDKVAAVEELVAEYRHVAMVGDGINDAPAMARATVGIAMGAMGTDAAIETADIALMSDDLTRLAWLVRHSRRTLEIVKQNITAALGVKLLFVLLTFVGRASLWAAIAADMGVSLLVVFNALRLLSGDKAGTVQVKANGQKQQQLR